mgnify:CR=1 FL=1
MSVTHEAEEAQEQDGASTLVTEPLPERDVRARRPAALGFVLRWDTLRRLARIVSLLALDFASLFGAIFSALALKAALLNDWNGAASLQETQETVSFAYLITALLFARSGLYAARATRPGLTRIVGSLFQTTVVTLIFALVNGETFSSYYIFYGTLFFAVLFVSSARWIYEAITGAVLRAAGYQRRAVLVGTGKHIEAVAHALLDAPDHAGIEVVGFISLTPRPDNGLRSLGTLDEIERILTDNRLDEVIIADPDFPQQEAVELVDRCHRKGVRVRVAPSTMEILIHRAEFVPGQSVPLFELKPPVFDGIDFVVKRVFDVVLSILILLVLSPLLIGIAIAVFATSRGPVLYRSVRPGIGGQPFSCLKFRTMQRDADQRQADLESLNEAKGASDAATWLPPHKPFRCRYVIRQVRVKAAYGLWVTAAERDAIARELGRCDVAAAGSS